MYSQVIPTYAVLPICFVNPRLAGGFPHADIPAILCQRQAWHLSPNVGVPVKQYGLKQIRDDVHRRISIKFILSRLLLT